MIIRGWLDLCLGRTLSLWIFSGPIISFGCHRMRFCHEFRQCYDERSILTGIGIFCIYHVSSPWGSSQKQGSCIRDACKTITISLWTHQKPPMMKKRGWANFIVFLGLLGWFTKAFTMVLMNMLRITGPRTLIQSKYSLFRAHFQTDFTPQRWIFATTARKHYLREPCLLAKTTEVHQRTTNFRLLHFISLIRSDTLWPLSPSSHPSLSF